MHVRKLCVILVAILMVSCVIKVITYVKVAGGRIISELTCDICHMFVPQLDDSYAQIEPAQKKIKKVSQESESVNSQREEERPMDVVVEENAMPYEIPEELLKNSGYLLSSFYQVDPTTYADETIIDFEKFMEKQFYMNNNEGPKVLIYHTHSTEAYADSRPGNREDTVVGVGDYLKDILENQYGIETLHNTTRYDLEDKSNAYKNAAGDLRDILQKNPSIQVVIDLHRDGIDEDTRLVTTVDERPTAQIMFFNGICRDSQGKPMPSMENEVLEGNLAFSFQMERLGKAEYKDLVRKIYLRGYRYNMQYRECSMLLEVGAQNNTVEEAKNAMIPFAHLLMEVMHVENR